MHPRRSRFCNNDYRYNRVALQRGNREQLAKGPRDIEIEGA